jgi:hypothetical protein
VVELTIHDRDAYRDAAWDWGMLTGCFGKTRISPSDWDGVVERGGYFLQIEGKPGNRPVEIGQRITYQNRVLTGIDTVVVIWGTPPDRVTHMRIWSHDQYVTERLAATTETFRQFCAAWFEMADGCLRARQAFLGRIDRWATTARATNGATADATEARASRGPEAAVS